MDERSLVLSILFATILHSSYGCQMEGVTLWALPVSENILDTFRGTVISRSTSNIEDIINISYGEATIAGPYFQLALIDSQFVMQTNAAYENYEENEVASMVSMTVDFRCTGGNTNRLVFLIEITDTNNNAPRFIPSDVFEFVVAPPLPPGFMVTGCLNDITVRDIDLTTQRIDFTLEDNPYFEIEYDASASTEAKEFKAILKSTTFIRSLPEPLTFTITATDVDLTNDPPLSATATLRIVGDSEFQFPEEPIFDQTFYLANYTETHQLNLFETISLQQGFDEYVNFTLEGEFANNFNLITNGNQVSISVATPLPSDVWFQRQIFLIVRATREFTSGDTTTVIAQLPEEVTLQFERAYYEGSIVNNSLQLSQLVLTRGYESVATSAEVVGEYSSYFTASVQENLITLAMSPIPNEIIDNNSLISIQVDATNDRSGATTVVSLEIVKDDNATPVFDKSIYTATYDPVSGLNAEQITFVQGFDDTVSVELDGEYASFFQINQNGSIITLTSSTIPPEIYSLQNILITIEARKPRTVGANAAINIALPAARELEFEESIYRGTIEDNELTLQPILLSYGFGEGVSFNLSGEYATYFTATHTQSQLVISLTNPLPDAVITQNSVIMLTLTASGINAITTSTNIILDIIKEDATTPVFSRNIYYGTYSGTALEVEVINLAQGYDTGVTFRLDGAHAQYFSILTNGNNAVIALQTPIPEDVIFNEKFLLFNVLADKALTVGANAAVLITFPAELTESAVMTFSRNTYIGYLNENEISLENVFLETGFASGTEFLLTGDYAEHFILTSASNLVQISSLSTLPNEVTENNHFIVLEIEARRQRAVSAWTSVVVDIIKQDVIAPVFNQAYYTGVYTDESGLSFEETINLAEGYDETVIFALVGELSTWFQLEQNNNSVSLELNSPIPIDVVENNNQLLFTIVADKSNITGRAVISIDLPKDFINSSFRFNQDYYKGYIEDVNLTLDDIILHDYTPDVNYTLTGDFANYFQLTNQDGTFTLQLPAPLANEVLEQTDVFVFTLNAHNRNIRTHTAIVIENLKTTEDVNIDFEQPYYIGAYLETTSLEFDSEIRLVSEIDQLVTFGLEGDDAQWFGVVQNENSVTVVLTSAIPAAVLAKNQQLVFMITAQRPGSATARATVIITLVDEHTESSAILGFDRVTYVGSIENAQSTIPVITLSEGFTQEVVFILHGELANYFLLTWQGAVVSVTLQNEIPEQLIPANRIIVLEVQATAPDAIPASATIVMEYVMEGDSSSVIELIFAQSFYSGSYSTATGLSFPGPLTLTQGYDSSVEFALEGDDAQWFGVVQNENSVTVVLTSAIPAAVLANNQQLVFMITAQRPDSATARATVIITLVDEHTESSAILGFDRVTYIGSIENAQSTIPIITLSEGYTQEVVFTLHGELANYFLLTWQGAVVSVTLQNEIPEQLIPANRIIVLEVQATAPDAIPASATIVMEYVMEGDSTSAVELIFAQSFYSGSYSAATGLSFPGPLTLTQGYDSSVEFALEGDDAQWFGVVQNENSVTVVLTSAIPAAVLANNQQLVFMITAQRPGSATARATVIITVVDDHTESSAILGFDRVTYIGSIENAQSTIPVITLSEGYTQEVVFTLHGELANYFLLTWQGAVVSVTLQNEIPEQLIPANRIIVLEVQATAPDAIPASATIVMEYVMEGDSTSAVELIFAQSFYSGSYSAATGLLFPGPLTLTQGYDSSVEFALEGDDAQWFGVVQNENSVTVVLTSAIPAAVLANNQQLVFMITAQRPGSATARATVIITLVDDHTESSAILGFDRVTYIGSIENAQSTIPVITLSEGYTQEVVFTLHGELANYFLLTWQGAVVSVTLQNEIPEQLIPANRIIVLEVQATAPDAIPASATIVMEYVMEGDSTSAVELIFAQSFYSGSYSAATGLLFPGPLTLTQGYDSSVEFALEGDDAQWFGVVQNENSVTVVLTSAIPAAVLANNQQLVFIIIAQRPGSATARATVIITLVDDHTESSAILGFDRVTYIGSIENAQSTIPVITLSEGYTQEVVFTLHGELANYFLLTWQGAVVSVTLQNEIPEQLIPANRIIVLEVQATAPDAIPASATIVIEYVMEGDSSSAVEIIFAQSFYSGSYSAATGLSFPGPLTLTQGYDSSVEFALEGDDAQWFGVVQNENSVTVVLTSAIPAAVLANNQQLVFMITAQRPGSATARATVIITLVDEHTESSAILGFDRVTYVGSIENAQSTIPVITLSEGYTQEVVFTLHGELANYFLLTWQGAVVSVTLQNEIPEQLIPVNRIIVLEVQATAPDAIPASATIVMEYVMEGDSTSAVELIFAQSFYSGSYSAATGLLFPDPLTLTQGYDSSVEFALEGDDAQWFGVVQNENSVTVVLTSAIPAAVLANNQQLVFIIIAQRPGSATARATVIITLVDDHTESSAILGFDRVTYIGSIENAQSTIPVITLSEGYTQEVVFTLHGELANYFLLTWQGAVVSVTLQNEIPEQLIPANRIIVLEVQATAPDAIPASATIVIEYVMEGDSTSAVELIFAQSFYSGSYSAATGLLFPDPLTLTQGYDSSVEFALEGDDAQWFGVVQNENSVTVVLTSAIPAAVLANNQQLVFIIIAQRPGSATARATVIITLVDDHTESSAILGFDRVTYIGSIENAQSTIPVITLSEGYTQEVVFTLHGELANYFLLTWQGAVVSVTLQNEIPEQLIPANRIIVLEVQATAPDAIPASATIVIEYVMEGDSSSAVEIIFAQSFYSGSYSAATGLSFPGPLTLTQGYDSSVEFALEGDDAQWFGVVQNENSVTVVLTSAIPAAVLANNQQLVFMITAQRPGSATARATVIITLVDEHTESSAILGFDRVTYVGSIENAQSTIPVITLSEGYTQEVVFTLHGELANYFLLTWQGAVVSVTLQNEIPEQLIPANRIIVLEVQATAPDAIPASATIVIEYVMEGDSSSAVEIIFAQSFYSGSYSAATGLSFPGPLTLTQGYDSSVEFALEGDDAQWFGVVQNENSVTVVLTSAIPAAVLANNQQLVFIITAQRPGSATARATVIITLVDEHTESSAILGFDRVTYIGSIENAQSTIPVITLSEGYTQEVVFTLHGELANYFLLTWQEAVVSVTLQNEIPEQLIPANRIIVLEVQATAPDAIPASATIVMEYVMEGDSTSAVELIFAQSFYSGSYSAATGLSFPGPLTLTQGYDSSVEFALEGDDAQWFGVVQNENSVTVVLTSAIPAAVLANNQQLVFMITAQRPGSATARATVIITLVDDHTESSAILGFDRVTYIGSIENAQSTIPVITLSEGYTQEVVFTLHGELANYFLLTWQGAVVSVTLQNEIPEQLIPVNRIIVLEVQATAPDAIPASATIVMEYVTEGDSTSAVELIFAQSFYSGSYSAATDLLFPGPLTLTQGYDSSVEFALEGDDAQWFGVVQNENSVTVVLTSAIPAAVLANNQQLVFIITAQRPGSATARATVIITLVDDHTESSAILGFDRVTYIGSIENAQSTIPVITLSEGYTQEVVFTLHGELANYFLLTWQGAVVSVTLQNEIPEQLIPANRIIVLEVQATAPDAIPASATIVMEYVMEGDSTSAVELIFAQSFYSGSYSAATDLLFPGPLTLTQGYDSSVEFALEGDDAQWFGVVQNENSVTVVLTSAIPAAVLVNNQQLVFIITAQRPGSATARATVIITLVDDHTESSAILGFDRVTYIGSIENAQSTIPVITLSEGYTQEVVFTLHGELANYFLLTWQGAVVSVTLQNEIPEQLIPVNRIIVLEVQATAPDAIPASATIVMEYVTEGDSTSAVELIFAQSFYSGSYSAATGLSFPGPLTLTQGYDSSVEFALEGDDAQWFGVVQNENSVTVVLTSAIPAAVLANNQQLVFIITAQRPGSATARATVIITLVDEHTESSAILGFDRATYVGSIENAQSTIPVITLSEGYTQEVVFTLHGELANYFLLTWQGPVVSVTLQNEIPEQLIPANRIIVLEVQATAPDAIPASATIVIEYVMEGDSSSAVEIIFAQSFYSGSYSAATGLSFPGPLTLTQGYDSSVEFALEGDDAQWFGVVQNENSVTVVLTSAIPAAVLANNQQLVFIITAQRPGSATARATVIITLVDEHTESSAILGFDRVTYIGSIENAQSTIPVITLSEGYTQEVVFTLHGELANYFLLTWQGAVVSVTLQNEIPEQLIPANRIIVLEVQATAPDAIPASATIVMEYVMEGDSTSAVELIFAQSFYSGSYSAATGLSFPGPLTLTQGYDSSVEFALEGDDAQWFGVVQNENSVTVVLTSAIPAAVLANNQQLVFMITAQRPGSATARATVIITLVDDHTESSAILGFDRVTYIGSIENAQSTIPVITLSEGYTQEVVFTLHGELANYFLMSWQGAVVSVTLQNEIPEQLIPANRIIVLEVQATAPDAIPASATIVMEYVMEGDSTSAVELIFAQSFYSGSYSAATDLLFPGPLTLTQGYDSSVEFALEGDDAQWFGVVQNENSVTVVLTSAIPAAVLVNNQQLVFIITAQRPGSATARATVIITLVYDHTESSAILGFDRVTYIGSIENAQSTIPVITLSEGYTQEVVFTLHGELANYFLLTWQGAVVSVTLQNEIPEQLIPVNRIIVLEVQATAPDAIPASATIVMEYVTEGDSTSAVELIFAQSFYSGSYSAATGLSFPGPLTLTQGYDSSVEFALEGDDAQWFGVVQNENSVTVVLTSAIPAAVLANNQQLVFIITAQRPGSATARATVIITLVDEHTESSAILGFDRVTYVGSIENAQSTIPVITLSEGYTQEVVFTLHGELANYFLLTWQGAVVSVTLQNEIPEQLIPANRIIVLEVQATAPDAIPASATIVMEYVMEGDSTSAVELIFAQSFYSGSYSAATDLLFPGPLTLTQGYDSSVEFALEGDDAQWFGVVQNENSVTVVLTSAIPAAVLVNNQQLVFIITAQRPGSATARATVIITLVDEHTESSAILGFDRVTYVGSIENAQSTIPVITLSEGYTQEVVFTLHGELANYFLLTWQGAVVSVTLQNEIPEQLIPANRIIVLEVQATAPDAIPASATIVMEYVTEGDSTSAVELIFAQSFYSGSYSAATGLLFPGPLTLTQGYDSSVEFALEGDDAQWFGVVENENSVTVVLTSAIPAAVLANNQQLVFMITAQRPGSATARATVIITLVDDSQAGSDVAFDKVMFEGILQNGIVSHETIIVTGFSGSDIELHGEYSSLFVANVSNTEVTVTGSESITLPAHVKYVAIELRAGTAASVLLLQVIYTDVPSLPTVTFSSPSYAVRVDITHTGIVGQMQASADNGEAVTYSLLLDNAHLEERINVNTEGELRLSAPVNSGVYTFYVVATTVFTRTSGNATVQLSVEAITVCGDELVVAPLIVLDVDEEEPHYDLINGTQYENCYFTLTNRWPLDQSWLYIDEGRLHTIAIDREHESIAFMPVSQVQVEVILNCDGDATRTKRSLTSDALGPYDYGSNKWILTDTILYNSRRSLLNVIVNDINDNAPIFIGKEMEPIAVGYPVPELAETVLPRSLAELQATDADIGENAAIMYWSSAPELAVAPSTGFVHLRDGATLDNSAHLTVHATDRNGEGLTGSIDLLIRLLDESNIAVVTVRDAFLDDEQTVLSHLTDSVGYEVKVLRSVVISDGEPSEEGSRKRRDVSGSGASLQLYVYGLIAREPVNVDRLTSDISDIAIAPVIIASSVSLQDHLEGQEICVIAGRDLGLLVATIVLSVLLFIVLVLIAVWFFLRWRRKKNYNQFSDENSLESRNGSVDKFPRPEVLPKPRLDINELKKSERRLQEMLEAPDQIITIEPSTSSNDAILDLPTPELLAPIVIQSIDKLKDAADESSDDEFGETKRPKRKSVVTFNENVEKIIHVEDTDPEDISTNMGFEVYKL